ncbi:MAG: YicC/YloC family endoribonuclease [Planctomycetota bacterium]
MTGFGAASTDVDGAHFLVELRSVNNRFFKSTTRVPEDLQGIEPELEAIISRRLNRGSVTLTVRFTDASAKAAARINGPALQSYLDQLLEAAGDANVGPIDLGALLSLPGVVLNDADEDRLERAKPVLIELTGQACDRVLAMRSREGEILHADLHAHCDRIARHLAVINERAPVVIEQYDQRLRQRMASMLADTGTAVRDEDVLREVAIFAERSDISEEISRLQGHLAQFVEIIDADGDEPAGRTLDFLSQELLREANTIGSKCLDVEVSRRIVEIKGAIDRLKEQSQNVE